MGNRLSALHIHDNDLKNDNHSIPFDGSIDFEEVAKDLADSKYDVTLMLEILYGGEMPAKEYYSKAVDSARKLVKMVESYR